MLPRKHFRRNDDSMSLYRAEDSYTTQNVPVQEDTTFRPMDFPQPISRLDTKEASQVQLGSWDELYSRITYGSDMWATDLWYSDSEELNESLIFAEQVPLPISYFDLSLIHI